MPGFALRTTCLDALRILNEGMRLSLVDRDLVRHSGLGQGGDRESA